MPSPVAWSVHRRWSPDPRHVGDARRFVADRLAAEELGHLVDKASLIVSELATNAVRHAQTPFRVTMGRSDGRLMLEVHDDSASRPLELEGAPFDLDGRGLHLVSALSLDWGVTPHPGGGKSVWASLDVTDPVLSD